MEVKKKKNLLISGDGLLNEELREESAIEFPKSLQS